MKRMFTVLFALTAIMCCSAQETPDTLRESLSLEQCRELAVKNNRTLEQARTKVDMARYDRAIARANYFPDISATGTYLYNSLELNLISEEQSAALRNAGTVLQNGVTEKMSLFQQAVQSNPSLAAEYMGSPLWQTFIGTLSQTDMSQAVNSIGCSIDDMLHPDVCQISLVGVSLKQPLFVGGKIVASNRIATLAEELAQTQYDAQYQQTIVDVDQAYWQIVSIAAKKELAATYADLLETMNHDAEILVKEGAYTLSEQLAIKVKANAAALSLTQATDGLRLAKMLLCQMIGLPLDTEITLSDEGTADIPLPEDRQAKTMDEILEARSELKSLDNAARIYDEKVRVARADMMPQVALTANYLVTNPSLQNGFQNEFGSFWTAGVVVKVPVFHGLEALKKTQKAKAEAQLYHSKYDDCINLVNLEVTQLYARRQESASRLVMAQSNLECAEENLRAAMLGFSEGMVESSVTLAAQTAWMEARTECIDAGIELQMIETKLNKAEGTVSNE